MTPFTSASTSITMPLTLANGIEINYSLTGSGRETVVLINGLADDLTTWSAQLPALHAAGFRVLTFDNRGIGASSAPPGPYSAEQMAEDTKALVEVLGIIRFHLMGVSMGGMIAQAYALKYPGDLISLTLGCTYAAPGPFCSRMFRMWADAAVALGPKFVMRDVLLWCFTLDFFERGGDALREVEDGMMGLQQPLEAYLAQLAVIQDFNSTEDVHKLAAVRTLVLAGEEDILIPTRLSRNLAGMIEGAEWKTVKGGHACMWEFQEEFNEAFIAFLTK